MVGLYQFAFALQWMYIIILLFPLYQLISALDVGIALYNNTDFLLLLLLLLTMGVFVKDQRSLLKYHYCFSWQKRKMSLSSSFSWSVNNWVIKYGNAMNELRTQRKKKFFLQHNLDLYVILFCKKICTWSPLLFLYINMKMNICPY